MPEIRLKSAPGARKTRLKPKGQNNQTKVPFWSREIQFGKTFKGKDKYSFFQGMATLIGSGLSIREGLSILLGQSRKGKITQILQDLSKELEQGEAFSTAMQASGKVFTEFEIASIRMGESSGQLLAVLKDLARFHEKRQRLRRKLSQALTYPIAVIFLAGGVLWFMLNFVVPMFSDIFARFDAELPGITQVVLALSAFLQNHGGLLFLGAVLLGFLLFRLRKQKSFQRISSAMLLKMPLFGPLIYRIQLSRYCYSLSLMLKSKLSLDQALKLLEKVTPFYPLQQTIPHLHKDVTEGKSFFEAVQKHPIYNPMFRQMVQVGERTANLDHMLEQLGKNLEEEGESRLSSLTSLIEPVLILVLGLIVGIILISMYLPMFELSNTISP